MPTWRSWLEDISEEQFKKSEYYQRYKAFLQDERLKTLLEKENITLNFDIHPNLGNISGAFRWKTGISCLIPFGAMPLNQLLMEGVILITDYLLFPGMSTIRNKLAWEFYPFDLETYEKVQGSYMDYKKYVFGDLAWDQNQLVDLNRENWTAQERIP